jgi:hypothetical protein
MGTDLSLIKECECGRDIFIQFGRKHNYEDNETLTIDSFIVTVLSLMLQQHLTEEDVIEIKDRLADLADDFIKIGRSEVIEELRDECNKFKIE